MKTSTKVLAGVGAGIGLSALIFFAGRKPRKKVASLSGFSVGPNCTLTVHNIATARATAYATGLAGPTYEEAKANIFGGCGQEKKLQLYSLTQVRHVYLLAYEVLRGSLNAGYITRALAEAVLADATLTVSQVGVDLATIPTTLP